VRVNSKSDSPREYQGCIVRRRADREELSACLKRFARKHKARASPRLVVPQALTSEAERDSAVDVDLVGVLGIAHDVTAPEPIAPPAGFVRLDVSSVQRMSIRPPIFDLPYTFTPAPHVLEKCESPLIAPATPFARA
jgi:hypothetical protein